jgi:hypothetical protein
VLVVDEQDLEVGQMRSNLLGIDRHRGIRFATEIRRA